MSRYRNSLLSLGMLLILLLILIVLLLSNIATSLRTGNERREKALELDLHDQQYASIPAEVIELLARGEKIAAIKKYRSLTGCSLRVAMAKLSELPTVKS